MPTETIVDHAGIRWSVVDSREVEVLGVRLALPRGRPADRTSDAGPPQWIITPQLADFYRSLRGPHMLTEVLIDAGLPLSKERIYAQRKQLGLHRLADTDEWWRERIDDLQSLTLAEFAERHGVHKSSVARRRVRLGITREKKQKRPRGWWRSPEIAAEFASGTNAAMAEKYGVSESRILQIRGLMRAEGLL
jgi:hypothetical protein